MKKSSDTIRNRTRDFPVCSAVPQPTAPPAACLLCEWVDTPTYNKISTCSLMAEMFSSVFTNNSELNSWNSLTFWHRNFTLNSNKSPTWCNSFSVYYPDVCLQLNMFRAFSRPSSGAQWLQWQPLVLPSYRGDSRVVFVVGQAGRPDHEHSTTVTCNYLLKSSTCFKHCPAHLQEVYVVIVYMQPLVSSLSAGNCPLHQLISSFLTGAQDSHLQRVTIPEAAYIQLRRRLPEDDQGNARNM